MTITFIFLTGGALAQFAAVFSYGGMPQHIRPKSGTCTTLHGLSIFRVLATEDIGLKFYNGKDCNGDQVATSSGSIIEPRGVIEDTHSVKTVSRHELTDSEAGYFASRNEIPSFFFPPLPPDGFPVPTISPRGL